MKFNIKSTLIILGIAGGTIIAILFVKHGSKQPMITSNKYIYINQNNYTIKMSVEDFIPCVLFAQMDIEQEIEAVKAQAVIDRTYIMYMLQNKKEITTSELGLPFNTYERMIKKWEQMGRMKGSSKYKGLLKILIDIAGGNDNIYFKEKISIIEKVMEETKNKVMKYNGKIVLPLFHEISGGKTRDGMMYLGEGYEYLVPTDCQNDYMNKDYKFEKNISLKYIDSRLVDSRVIVYDENKAEIKIENQNTQNVIDNIKLTMDENGYVKTVKLWNTVISGDDFAKIMKIPSSNYTMECIGNQIHVIAKGKGHGFGLSMSQAMVFAKEGMKYEEILKKFYNVSITE